MLACWDKEPSKRPSFQEIMQLLDEVRDGQMVTLFLLVPPNSLNPVSMIVKTMQNHRKVLDICI